MRRSPPPPLDVPWDVLEAIGDQAAVLDADGVVIRANCAWRQTPEAAQSAAPRCEPGVDYPAHLRLTSSRSGSDRRRRDPVGPARALPAFQSDYDAGERAYSLQVEPLPHGGALVRHVDISFRQHLQRQLAHRATHDAPDRTAQPHGDGRSTGQALIRAARTGSTVAVLFCDVDRFKQINDTQRAQCG